MIVFWLDVVWLLSCVVSGATGAMLALWLWSTWGGTWVRETTEGGAAHEAEKQ